MALLQQRVQTPQQKVTIERASAWCGADEALRAETQASKGRGGAQEDSEPSATWPTCALRCPFPS